MVQQGDFEVQLVEAVEKTPFKEHNKDGTIYVEVEPEIEYFIAIQRTKTNREGACMAVFFVDDQDLKFQQTYSSGRTTKLSYQGLFSRANGVSATKALKFTKPRMTMGETGGKAPLMMGKVEVKIYEAIYHGMGEHRDFSGSSITAAPIDLNQGGNVKKKNLRSGEGSTVLASAKSEGAKKGQQYAKYSRGTLLDTITLNYCAALGLMEVGVLPKPDMWTYHRMKRPAEPGTKSTVQPKKIRDVVSGEEKEQFDLTGDGEE